MYISDHCGDSNIYNLFLLMYYIHVHIYTSAMNSKCAMITKLQDQKLEE